MKLNSMAISGLLTMEMHSLNNEGAEGNHLMTRQVQVVDMGGKIHAVNAVSGDMFKHMQAEHLYNLAKEEGLPLCDGCSRFNANRIGSDDTFAASFEEGVEDSVILSGAITRCVLDDAEGILITREIGKKARAIGRKSAVEFGWVVGRPESTRTEAYFHVKYVPEGRGSSAGEGANLGQNIFHRPASSGQYAVVLNLDLYRIGKNDINLSYVLDIEERCRRLQALLKSVLFTFIKPVGAQRNTQNPHILSFEGCISCSNSTYPAPQASALNPEFQKEIEIVSRVLNNLKEDTITLYNFNSLSEFAGIMEEIIKNIELCGV
ncbi:MAG: DevR family CRISPR-associated autoregulator [Peptococcaceae bacterium]|nr:DevR family CRISPR-associated autoregulator [Peptococcaceae bacterium]